jgi:hypothetical protein
MDRAMMSYQGKYMKAGYNEGSKIERHTCGKVNGR